MTTPQVSPQPGSALGRIHAHGLDEASEQLAPFLQARYVQLERGVICFHGAVASLGAMTLGHYQGSRNKVEWLEVPRDRTLMIVPKQGSARLGTTSLGGLQVAVVHGPMQLIAFTDRDFRPLFASMPAVPGEAVVLGAAAGVHRRARASHIELFALSEAQASTFESHVEDALAAAENSHSRAAELALAAELQASVTRWCSSWSSLSDAPKPPSDSAARCHAAVRAREFIDRHLDQRLSLASVCRASYSSPRALEYGFREVYGISPMAYVRCSRLSRVRRELYVAPQVNGIVTQAAMKWGFWHLSQFSRDYHDLFGELPSATLSRENNDRNAFPCHEPRAGSRAARCAHAG